LDYPRTEQLQMERREADDVASAISLDPLFSGFEPGPKAQARPEDPIAQLACIPSIRIAADGPIGETYSAAVDVPSKADMLFNLPTSNGVTPSNTATGRVEAQMPELLKASLTFRKLLSNQTSGSLRGIESKRSLFVGS
jgi:hypothetical protein